MPKVYIVTEPISYKDGQPVPLFDISPAMKYGDIEILTQHNQSMLASVPMVRMLRDKLKDFCDEDVILPVGDPTIIATVAAIASDINGGYFRMLKWDKRSRSYMVIDVDAYGNSV